MCPVQSVTYVSGRSFHRQNVNKFNAKSFEGRTATELLQFRYKELRLEVGIHALHLKAAVALLEWSASRGRVLREYPS